MFQIPDFDTLEIDNMFLICCLVDLLQTSELSFCLLSFLEFKVSYLPLVSVCLCESIRIFIINAV